MTHSQSDNFHLNKSQEKTEQKNTSSSNSLSESRRTLRKSLRLKRQLLTKQEQDNASQQLLDTFLEHFPQDSEKHPHSVKAPPITSLTIPFATVALYLANDGEISPSALCDYLWSHNVKTYLPVVQGEALVFAHYDADSVWQKNKFGIAEPIDPLPVTGMSLDMVLLPLVGFDTTGARLGMGGGFYDKTFSTKQKNESPLLIGLAHDCQRVDQLPIESWDVPLDGILTGSVFINI